MSFEYVYDPRTRIVRIKLHDVLSLRDVVDYGKRVTGELPDGVGFVELVDFRGLEEISLSYDDSGRLRDLFVGLKENKGYRGSVILVGSEFQFGMARMLSAGLAEVGTVHIVREQAEAETSLQSILADEG